MVPNSLCPIGGTAQRFHPIGRSSSLRGGRRSPNTGTAHRPDDPGVAPPRAAREGEDAVVRESQA